MTTPASAGQDKHSLHSSFLAKLIEYLFIGELLKRSWETENCLIEISRPEVDRAGYDLIIECNGHVRHVQLKTSYRGSTTATQIINLSLAQKPSGCVLWIYFDRDSLVLGPFLYFGGSPGKKMPSLDSFRAAKHKVNAQGVKAERSNHRIIPRHRFIPVESVEDLWRQLFGND